jgi:HEAT repeat protein
MPEASVEGEVVMGLELEPSAPPSESPPAASGFTLEDESLGIAGKVEDEGEHQPLMAEPVEEEEEMALDIPVAAPAPATTGNACPKCGAALPSQSIMCVECGTRLDGAAPAAEGPKAKSKKKKKKKDKEKKGRQSSFLGQHAAFIAFVLIGIAVTAGIVFGIVKFMGKRGIRAGPPNRAQLEKAAAERKKELEVKAREEAAKAPPPSAAPSSTAAASAQPAPSSSTPPATTPVPAPRLVVAPKTSWDGFASASLKARDKTQEAGNALLAFLKANNHFPAELREVTGILEDELYEYVGPDVAKMNRFRPLLWERNPSAGEGKHYVFFSDGAVRPVTRGALVDSLPVQTDYGFISPTEQRFLGRIRPEIRIVNQRFAAIDIAVDGTASGRVGKGGTRSIPVEPGAHQITLSAGEHSATLDAESKEGLVLAYGLPLYEDLPYLPFRDFKNAMTRPQDAYQMERRGNYVAALQGQDVRVEFPAVSGRQAISIDARSLTGRVIIPGMTIEGIGEQPIGINRIGRLEAGKIIFPDGRVVSHQRTDLGPVAIETSPNLDVASGYVFFANQGNLEAGREPELMGNKPLEFVDLTYQPTPNLDVIQGPLQSRGASNIPLLVEMLNRANTAAAPQNIAPPTIANGTGAASSRRSRQEPAPDPQTAAQPPTFLTYQPRTSSSIATGRVFAALALYANPSSLRQIASVYQQAKASDTGYAEMLLALARTGGGSVLAQLKSAGAKAPIPVAVTLTTIEDPSAKKALSDVMSGLNAGQIHEAALVWPDFIGIPGRRLFVDTAVAMKPGIVEDYAAINGLMRIEPQALQRHLAPLVHNIPAAAPPPPPPPPAPAAPAQPPQLPQGDQQSRRAGAAAARRAKRAADEALMRRIIGADDEEEEAVEQEAEQAEAATPTGPAAVSANMATVADEAPPAWRILAHYHHTDGIADLLGLLTHNDISVKRKALAALAEASDPSIVPFIVPLLSDKEASIRSAAACSLAMIGNEAAVQALESNMTQAVLFAGIIKAIPRMEKRAGREATSNLMAVMLQAAMKAPATPQPAAANAVYASEVRWDAPANARMILNAMLEISPLSDRARAAVENASRSGDPELQQAASMLAAMSMPRQQQKGNAVRGIRKLAGIVTFGRGEKRKVPSGDTEAIEKALKDASPDARAMAVTRLATISVEDALPHLKGASSDSAPKVRATALRVLANLPDTYPDGTEMIIAGLKDSDASVVAAAAYAASHKPDPAMERLIITAMNKPSDAAVRVTVLPDLAAAAGALRAESATSALILMLADQNRVVKQAAARALGRIGDPNSVLALVSTLQDAQDPMVAGAVVEALSHFDTQPAMEATLGALGVGNLPMDTRMELLKRMVAEADSPGIWGEWVRAGPPLGAADLQLLSQMAQDADRRTETGLLIIADRYLNESADPQVRSLASMMVVPFHTRPEVRNGLLSALMQNAAGIAPAAAEMIKRNRNPDLLEPLNTLYRNVLGAMQTPDRFPGLAKASPDELAILRTSIIEGAANVGGDEAARMLRRVYSVDTDIAMIPRILSALERTGSPLSVRYIGEIVERPNPYTNDAIRALVRVSRLDTEMTAQTLTRIVQRSTTPPDIAAVAADALDEMLVMADI